jgi:large subunit ribosomal protein L4
MKNVSVHDIKGKVTGKFSLDETYFDGRLNQSLLHQAALIYLANKRGGCASTKIRSQVRGGGRKPWRQKGTGRARVGSIRSPLWRGGGVVFGPHPRQYRSKLSKNIRSSALKASLNAKIKDAEFVVLEDISETPTKTKEFTFFLKAVKAGDKPLLVVEKYSPQLLRAARNIPGVTIKTFNNICALDVLRHEKIIFSKQGLENLVKLRK